MCLEVCIWVLQFGGPCNIVIANEDASPHPLWHFVSHTIWNYTRLLLFCIYIIICQHTRSNRLFRVIEHNQLYLVKSYITSKKVKTWCNSRVSDTNYDEQCSTITTCGSMLTFTKLVCAIRLHSWICWLFTHANKLGPKPDQKILKLCLHTI